MVCWSGGRNNAPIDVCCPPSLVIASSAVNHKVTDGSEVKNDETRHVMRVMGHFGKMRSGDPPVLSQPGINLKSVGNSHPEHDGKIPRGDKLKEEETGWDIQKYDEVAKGPFQNSTRLDFVVLGAPDKDFHSVLAWDLLNHSDRLNYGFVKGKKEIKVDFVLFASRGAATGPGFVCSTSDGCLRHGLTQPPSSLPIPVRKRIFPRPIRNLP
ncbi:hypothetical protein MTP99_016419 [Tenebrio molitor]|nr:hypothetical protein MTP99_016419 [Tenebrio molitor]